MRDPIPFHQLQDLDSGRLVRRYKIRRGLADLVSRAKLHRRTDLLDDRSLTEGAKDRELLALLRPSRLIPDPTPKELVIGSAVSTYKGFVLLVRDLEDGRRRGSIEDGRGELISADLTPENRARIRFSSVRLLGYDLSELLALEETERIKGLHRLNSVRDTPVGDLWRERDMRAPGGEDPVVFQALSALLNAVLYLTRPRSGALMDEGGTVAGGIPGTGLTGPGAVPGDITPPAEEEGECGPGTGWLADLIPELNIADCCKAHDECYEKGCTSCDKARCDYEFYSCILPKAGPAIAALYYDAVTAFGQASFNYCDGRWGLGGTIAVSVGIAIGVVVGVLAGPSWGVAAGSAAVIVSVGLHSQLCKICEVVKKWECTAWEERRYRECAERKEKRKKKCRKWKKWLRWLCRAWTYIRYWVCVAWTWIVHKLCVAGKWVITGLTC